MASNTVNISFQGDLLKKLDKLAREESRSRSEIIREAARQYISRKDRWDSIFDYCDRTKDPGISESDVVKDIKAARKAKNKK